MVIEDEKNLFIEEDIYDWYHPKADKATVKIEEENKTKNDKRNQNSKGNYYTT
jgi:hypothetical protein